MRRVTLRIEYDSDVESPNEEEHWWKLISFNPRHHNHENVEKYDLRDPSNFGLRRKLKTNLAFVCDYYEHSGIAWSRSGGGHQCQWDTSRKAGLLIFQGKPSDIKPENRIERADSFLKVYNDWANGSCYFVSVEPEGEENESCGGFIGDPDESGMTEHINEHLEDGDYVKVIGDAAFWKDNLKLKDGVEIVDDFDEIPEEVIEEFEAIGYSPD